MQSQAYRARWLFPVSGPPIRDGVLVWDERIVAVGRADEVAAAWPGEVIDLENVALAPALVNAHCHLELSHFDQPLAAPGEGFPGWIRAVVDWRRSQAAAHSAEELAAARRAAVERGLAESRAAGVGMVGDIASPGDDGVRGDLPQRVVFREVLGLATRREDELFAAAERALDEGPPGLALSPHAPYTVGVELLTRLAKLSQARRVPLAMHLAESIDELELLRSHSGAFLPLLRELDAWDPSAFPRGIAPRDYLEILATAHRALVIHGNYLTPGEIEFVAARRDRLAVVYCPRTHAAFGHARYPLDKMLRKGIVVAVGTDSRASNPDLNLWDELRFVADAYPELPLDVILKMGTQWGAAALGVDGDVRRGVLAPGAVAALQVVDLPEEEAHDPHELLFDARARVRAVLRPGETQIPAKNASTDGNS
jgi:aminodeoxyfutalosine deaminase